MWAEVDTSNMFNGLFNFKRNAEYDWDERQAQLRTKRRITDVRKMGRTQDAVQVVDAHDNLVILRDGHVIAAVGFGSLNDAMLDPAALNGKLMAYRALLHEVRFSMQLLVGTRPQNLERYQAKLQRQQIRINQQLECIDRLLMRLPSYVSEKRDFSDPSFEQFFEFAPTMLFATPGDAYRLAQTICRADVCEALQGMAEDARREKLIDLSKLCDGSVTQLKQWGAVITERSEYVEMLVMRLEAPVRTFYLVTSFKPRIVDLGNAPLDDRELARAQDELSRRCEQLIEGIDHMDLPAWRASHDDLIRDIQYFYHPSHLELARRESRLDRSVGMQLGQMK